MQVSRHWREIPERYRMEAIKCSKCSQIFFPKRVVCPDCKKQDFENIKLSGKGILNTFTIIRVPPAGFADQVPYAIGIVELEEGIKITTQITDCNPEMLKIGDKMVTEFRRINEEGKNGVIMYGYKFVPDRNS